MTPIKYVFAVVRPRKFAAEGPATLSPQEIFKTAGYRYSIIPWLGATPFLLMFVIPFILYGGNLDFRTSNGVYHISDNTLYYVLFMCATWSLIVAIFTCLFSGCLSKKAAVEYWKRSEVVRLFLLLYVVGLPVFVIHQLVSLPVAFENLIHIISVAAYLAFGLGISLIFDHRRNTQPNLLSVELILTCSTFAVLVLLPIVLGKATDVAYASAVLITALAVVRVRPAMQSVAILLAGSLVAGAMLVKTPIRQLFYDGSVFSRIDISDRCFPRLLDCLHEKLGQRPGHDFSSWFDDDVVSFASYDPNFNKLIFSETILGGKSHYVLGRIVHRLNHLGVLAHAVSLTPEAIPFWGWKTYSIMPYVMIPRVVWPEKPQAGVANFFGRQYKILDQQDMQTTANIDPITEAWINGGWLAILLSSIVIGALLGGLLRWLRGGGDQDIRFLAAIVIAVNVACFESEAALIAGGLLQELMFLGVILVVFRLLTKWHRLFWNSFEEVIPSKG